MTSSSRSWLRKTEGEIFTLANGIADQSSSRRSPSYWRLATRCGQSEGQSMVTSLSVAQSTVQMLSDFAGQNLLALRLLQIGQINEAPLGQRCSIPVGRFTLKAGFAPRLFYSDSARDRRV